MNDLKIGDEVFHKSNSSIKWVVEKIDDNEVYCSTVIKETLEQKKEIFALTSIEKCSKRPNIIVGKVTRNNHY
jgi:hypothetical protein